MTTGSRVMKLLHAGVCRLGDYTHVNYALACRRSNGRPNAVFLWVPKAAGTSLFSVMKAPKLKSVHRLKYRFCGRGTVSFVHMDYAALVEQGLVSRAFDESAYKFAIVRNPYARAVSLHAYLLKLKRIPPTESFLNFCLRLDTQGCEPIGLYNARGLSQCNPQVRWTEGLKIDFIGRVESIDQDAAQIFAKLGLSVARIPQLNTTNHSSYTAYFCPESKQIVERFYSEDFEAFGYPYEDFSA